MRRHPIGGEHPPPMTAVSLDDVQQGRWQVDPAVAGMLGGDHAALQRYLVHYCRRLGETGKDQLMIWPYHAMLGGIGQALVSAVEEACFFHALARHSPTRFEIKGGNPLTENYSALRPEVLDGPGGQRIAQPNLAFIEHLLGFDAVIIAGQAKSHCVAWTVEDLLREIQARDRSLAAKLYLLEDCTSPVVVPGAVDFTKQAAAAFERFAAAGVHVVRSSEALGAWPGLSGCGSR